MQSYPTTIIFRHYKERLKKCSLRGLEKREDMQFFRYPLKSYPSVEGYIVLALDAPPLTVSDQNKGLLLIDATWRYAEKMLLDVRKLPGLHYRSLPASLRTAYPRRQGDCSDPDKGLASAEALYAAYRVLERNTEGILDNYYWKDEFIENNYCL